MGKSYLKQILTYVNKVYDLGEKINTLENKKIKSPVKVFTISFIVLLGFMLQIKSFNRLKHWIKRDKFKELFSKKTSIPDIDAIRRSLSDFDLGGLKVMNNHIIKKAIKNRVFKNGTVDNLKVVAVDDVELFDSTKKCCDKCLNRVDKNGVTHYFHRSVVCATVGNNHHLIIGQEMPEPKKDGSDKGEGEITGGKRLIKRLYKQFHYFANIIAADALYCKSTWIKEVLAAGMDAVIRVKDERLYIVKDALALFKSRQADNTWKVNKSANKKILVKAWDEDNFEMSNLDSKVRFLKFLEEIHSGDKIEFRESWIITTDKYISSETLWEIMHDRWHIENNAFHQLKTEWHLDHCFLHSSTGVEIILMFIILAFNLMQLYFFRCIRGFRKNKMLQIDFVEDMRDDLIRIHNWINPIFEDT
jgi:hypothetical protein